MRASRAFRVEVQRPGRRRRASPRRPSPRVLGGSGADAARAIAVDAQGDTYITGETASRDFPVPTPAQPGVPISAFVVKLDPTGRSSARRSSAARGTPPDAGSRSTRQGRVYVTGATNSTDFPATRTPFSAATAAARSTRSSRASPRTASWTTRRSSATRTTTRRTRSPSTPRAMRW